MAAALFADSDGHIAIDDEDLGTIASYADSSLISIIEILDSAAGEGWISKPIRAEGIMQITLQIP